MSGLNEVIPTIDLKEIPNKLLNEKIREASERWGCFKVINHGVSLSLISEMKKTVRDLHELPLEVKRRNTDVILGSGYKPRSNLTPFYESFGLYDTVSSQAINTFCDQLDASHHQRKVLVEYGKAVDGLARDLARRIGESYKLGDTEFFKEWPSQFRMSKYHLNSKTIGKLCLRTHTDPGFLTIVQGDEDVGGLQAMDPSSETYFPIDTSSPNTFTVNLGDMARLWSNGRLCNVKHRVECNTAKTRITISTFLLGPMDREIEPPSEFVDAEHPRIYKSTTDLELRKIRLRTNMHDGESLKFVTLEYLNDPNNGN